MQKIIDTTHSRSFSTTCLNTEFPGSYQRKNTHIIKEQLSELLESHILAEPEAQNTAPCITYSCWKIKKKYPQVNIVVTPSDALVINMTKFARCIDIALKKTFRHF